MKDLSMHILDIAENSVKAKATQVDVELKYVDDVLEMTIHDNGCGMDVEMGRNITDPFVTSRTSRKVGLGLPFLKMNAEQTGGSVIVESDLGKGTTVKATFVMSHIDCVPQGNLASTLALLMTGNPDVNIRISIVKKDVNFEISSEEINEILDGVPISHPKVGIFIRNIIKETI
jgi:hypothetical protein